MLQRKQEVLLNTTRKLLRKNAHIRLKHIVEHVHPADVAVLFRFLPDEHQDIIFSLLSENKRRAEVMSHLEDVIINRLLSEYDINDVAEIIKEMDDDDAADMLANLDEDQSAAVLKLIGREEREEIEDLLRYDEDTAGGLMTTDLISLPAEMTADEALKEIKRQGEEPEMVFYLYLVDDDGRLIGVVSLREVVQSPGDTILEDIMTRNIHKVRTDTDQEEVASIIARYDLLAAPVVDEENVLMGIVTVDDIIDVIREEATEDILKLVGAHEELLEDYSLRRNVMSRLPWLLATWMGGILVMKLMGGYEDTLKKVLPLAAFIPVVIGMAGNLGTQSATIVVRGIALGKVDVNRLWDTVGKETMTGLVLGTFYGTALGVVAYFQYDEIPLLSVVVGLALCCSMLIAAMVGTLVPMVLHRMNVDPAVATGPFVTTSIDLVGVFVYFQISILLL